MSNTLESSSSRRAFLQVALASAAVPSLVPGAETSPARPDRFLEPACELPLHDDADVIVFNPHELLYVAVKTARGLAETGYQPPLKGRNIQVAGRAGLASLEATLVNMKAGGMISAHDYLVARAAATALCGGDVEGGSLVDEDWLLTVERKLFVGLLKEEKTQQRIAHTLETGKPLRN